MQHDPPTDLIRCLQSGHEHPTLESRRLHALELIRSGADIHSVTKSNLTCLHLAAAHSFVDVVQLLLEKGINVNAQDFQGNTALYYTCKHNQAETELVPMLLYHGVDPWIQNDYNETPLDQFLHSSFNPLFNHNDIEKWNLVATMEHLYYYMYDQYTASGISVYALLKMAELDLPIFHEILGTVKVDLDNLELTPFKEARLILTMPSGNLRLLLDKFDYIFIALFRTNNLVPYYTICNENVYILVGSHLQREFIDWLCRWKPNCLLLSILFRYPAPLASREEIVYYLLSCGMEIDEGDIDTVYAYCGYNDLFKLLRFMDVQTHHQMRLVIPRLVFQINGDIQKNIEDPRFWVDNINDMYSTLNLEHVLPYYAVRNLKDLCCEVKVKGKENLLKKLHDQPQIPHLVEMARNVFRKYFVQRLGITSAKQFYESLELLPISLDHRKIITLEKELYY